MSHYPPSSGSRRYEQSSPSRYDASPSRSGVSGIHPDSAFSQLRENRRLSRDRPSQDSSRQAAMAPEAQQGYWPSNASYNAPQGDIFTPEQNARESGLEAMRSPNYPQQAYQSQPAYGRGNDAYDPQTTQQHLRPAPLTYTGGNSEDRNSYSSVQGLNTSAVPMAESSPRYRSRSPGYATAAYTDDPYQGYSVNSLQNLGTVHPDEIYDDGDDGLDYGRRGVRTSMLSLGRSNSRGGHNGGAAAAGGVAAGAGVMGALGGLVGRNPGNRDGSGQYDAVQNGANTAYQGAGASTGDLYDVPGGEKSAWLAKQGASSKRWKWTIIGAIALIIAAAIALGVYFGIVRNKHGSGTSGESAADDASSNGDLSINSPEIKKLLNNVNLHKVFPGIDYTPINTQYPDCLHNPPSQNNVTRDLAVLSQLTNTIRLYGTDCNQTEMLIHATNQLQMNDTIKIWLGVWQDGNKTTNARQLSQMWDILDKYGDSPFKGVIVANEILFRKQMSATELGNLLSEVRTNITSKGMSLPVATSDLGDIWSSDLAKMSDYIMANIHPFFGGVNAKDAASWTYSFWENNNGQYFKSDKSKNIISETGWPSQGGTDCGTTDVTDCPDASVAGINELNQFMSDWVCQALTNGTQYFWFESFDEPWKIMYDEGDQNWEDHWGVMDVNRNLKKGVTIPDCDGKTVD
ncbi:putative glucan endo-1,3-beta-glucosidase btgC [Cytospora mali]|uniref:glucan endo-1,3-beta-D-glucosidase n=1 Tax=Cytospora mali TaxID=578113 RepID=A0A194W165_CYTMA|nr:putative glucan endo-1,3-beta-glucosidase btgC [Valsa mali]